MIDVPRLDIEENLMELCTGSGTGDGTRDNEGGGSSTEVEAT